MPASPPTHRSKILASPSPLPLLLAHSSFFSFRFPIYRATKPQLVLLQRTLGIFPYSPDRAVSLSYFPSFLPPSAALRAHRPDFPATVHTPTQIAAPAPGAIAAPAMDFFRWWRWRSADRRAARST